ncbi:hypothetical protein KRR40_22870 [Niabella defluvii]|nr:hypothetical protein KRR40_22870 [Niabella sp. I65]
MLEQILELVKQQGQQSVVQNTEVPDEKNNEVMMEAASTITGAAKYAERRRFTEYYFHVFRRSVAKPQRYTGHPVTSMMIGHLANNLMKK